MLDEKKKLPVNTHDFRLVRFLGVVEQKPMLLTHFQLLVEDKNFLRHAHYTEQELIKIVDLCRRNEEFLLHRYNITITEVEELVNNLRRARQNAGKKFYF